MQGDNQINKPLAECTIAQSDLLQVPSGTITELGVRENIRVGVQYLEAWLSGNGCVPLYNLMEDAATAEISRSQLWQWLKHKKEMTNGVIITATYYNQIMEDELNKIQAMYGKDYFNNRKFSLASEMFLNMISGDVLDEFLTLPAYEHI